MIGRRLRTGLTRALGGFRPEVVIFDLTHRCNSRCVACAFRDPEPGELPAARWGTLATEAKAVGFREIVLTGGEPLAHPDIPTILAASVAALPTSLLTNGLALSRHRELLARHRPALYVSLDAATDETYQRIRGVRGLDAVLDGMRSNRALPIHVRTTVWAENVTELDAIVARAKDSGASALSLLAADVSSAAFGAREGFGSPPRPDQLPVLRRFLDGAARDPFVQMSRYALERCFLLSSGGSEGARCAAPWTSGVVDPTGRWKPCFFLNGTTDVHAGIAAGIATGRSDRGAIDPSRNPVCARCVCWRG